MRDNKAFIIEQYKKVKAHGFLPSNRRNNTGIGKTFEDYIGDEENRGKGYGQEAIRLLLTYAFEYLNLNNIMLGLWSFNTEAYECYKKAGFKEIGRRRECYYLKGVYYDEILMDILQKDWFERKKTGE